MAFSVTNTFTNGTTANATEVNANFTDVENELNNTTATSNVWNNMELSRGHHPIHNSDITIKVWSNFASTQAFDWDLYTVPANKIVYVYRVMMQGTYAALYWYLHNDTSQITGRITAGSSSENIVDFDVPIKFVAGEHVRLIGSQNTAPNGTCANVVAIEVADTYTGQLPKLPKGATVYLWYKSAAIGQQAEQDFAVGHTVTAGKKLYVWAVMDDRSGQFDLRHYEAAAIVGRSPRSSKNDSGQGVSSWTLGRGFPDAVIAAGTAYTVKVYNNNAAGGAQTKYVTIIGFEIDT